MCGLFGFYSEGGLPSPAVIDTIAFLAARRGPDSFGFATEHGVIRGLGKMPWGQSSAIGAQQFMLGHCRLATVLANKTIEAAQPIIEGEWSVTHNGTIKPECYADLTLRTGNDSEAIALLLGARDEDIKAVMDELAAGGNYAVAIRNNRTEKITLAASGMPLWRLKEAGVVYWCSIKPGEGWEKV